MTGRIIKGIAGFYYVHASDDITYECKAKGIFRNRNEKPLVGDMVEFDITDGEKKLGSIHSILPRKNSIIRPAAANIDQALVIFAAAEPDPNYNLLDYFLVWMEYDRIPVTLCINKTDLVNDDVIQEFAQIYFKAVSDIIFVSADRKEGFEVMRDKLYGKLTVLAGPSGVGKSSVMNILCPDANAQTGDISKKLGRGKHTTRHSEIFFIEHDTYVMDTPGFSSLTLPDMDTVELMNYYPEFTEYEGKCRFCGCLHENEPDCAVKDAIKRGFISNYRYNSYIMMLKQIREQRKRQHYNH